MGDSEDVAKEIGGEVGHKTGSKIGKEDANAHAECPNHGNGTISAHFAFTTQPVDAETAGEGKAGCTEDGGESPICTHPHTT